MSAISPEMKAELKDEFHLDQEEIDNYASVFALFDEDGNGTIDIDELEKMISKLTETAAPSRKKLEAMMESVDADGDGTIDFREFVTLMTNRVKHDDPDQEIIDAFNEFDKDGSGQIDKAELKQVFKALGIKVDDAGLEDIVKLADKNDDGEIDFEEFKEMYNMLGLKVKSQQSRQELHDAEQAAAIGDGEKKDSCCVIA
mmetsp:Transcript_1591/g.1914  ORF Transcript_1591/g.1914 Transcript_1591/m.1914 type:complete len:200 (-) Transcript_1591:1290-1889(-)|eukprot:CAMPEP_0184018880 /NCGR_PEP_ID=MMETSP0954-20121128/8416_1 /TAXON_ID=627963 /ORGANISM="Aplanochytrium sp, Strain PBS07" /LENGTH=199 /DNA_ID=CAMNT_0026300433 /DNA_START=204 /DNA_END=803 /DNA_ORIENTATION=-